MNKTVLIIGYVWPEPKSSAAGSRMMQLIDAFQANNYNITFGSPCAKSENAFNLESIGVSQVQIELNNSSFDAFIKDLRPSMVLFDRFMMEEQFGWRIAEHCPDALRILDTEDLHCLRKGRHQAYKDNKAFDKNYLFNDVAKREIASIYRCDLSLIISEAEMEILKHQFKVDDDLLLYLPFMLDEISNKTQKNSPKFKDRNHFISVGNFLHEPNYNATLFLKDIIWPLIKKQLPKAEMNVYGAYASQKVNQLHNERDGFLIKGFAPDVNKVMKQAKVCLAPLRFGAGLKGKLIDAMLNGTPCVTSTIGAEGMYGDLDVNGFVENDPLLFAEKAVKLYTTEALWYDKHHKGFKVIHNRFDKNQYMNRFSEKIKSLKENLKAHRLQNFTGAMLLHHGLQSTKFMSKWIEEKNRKKISP